MGGKQTKRCPNGPGTSRAPALFRPDILEIVDFQAKIGIIRAFWLRKDLLDKVSLQKKSAMLFIGQNSLIQFRTNQFLLFFIKHFCTALCTTFG